MPPVIGRSGTALAELVVALVLAAVLLGVAGTSVSQHLRQRREREAADLTRNAVSLVRDVLRSALDHADTDIRLYGDTAVQLASLRAAFVSCDASGSSLVVPAGTPSWSAVRAGDSLAIADTVDAEWHTIVLSVRAERASAPCPLGGTRVVMAAAPPMASPPLLLPARIWREVRYALYRAGDGTWWLGERSCASACSSAQPIAGPLRVPSQGGLRFLLVPGADARPVALDLSVRSSASNRTASLWARLPLANAP